MHSFNIERITARTCLWPIVICLSGSFALSVGLTYRSNHHCFAGTCGETLFPFQARLHVVAWYLWISISIVFLAFRALHPHVRSVADKLSRRHISFGGKWFLSLTSCLLILWIAILYGSLIGIWWMRLHTYFDVRGQNLPGNNIVAAVAMTGHLADVTMGMVLLPVSRHSALASLFKISPVSTYLFHMIAGYVLFALVLVHGLLYLVWALISNANHEAFHHILPVLNPTYAYDEVWPGNTSILGYWRASLIFTGLASATIMVLIFFTSLPYIRSRHFNVFYFTHLALIIAIVIICLHASTMLYCTLPGILMWSLDWSMRVSELSDKLDGQLKTIGKGWFSLIVTLPSKRITGCACDSPLAHFYIHHSGSSIRELHPFTTITDLRSQKVAQEKGKHITVEFLIRKSQCDPTQTNSGISLESSQWTNKLCKLADEEQSLGGGMCPLNSLDQPSKTENRIKVRVEGPYFKTTNLDAYRTVVCLVAGTGVTGAIAIAKAFQARKNNCCSDEVDVETAQKQTWQRCIVIWIVREDNYVDLPYWDSLKCEGLEIIIQKTRKGLARRDYKKDMVDICGSSGEHCWAYISGPGGFQKSMKQACQQVKGMTWTVA